MTSHVLWSGPPSVILIIIYHSRAGQKSKQTFEYTKRFQRTKNFDADTTNDIFSYLLIVGKYAADGLTVAITDNLSKSSI